MKRTFVLLAGLWLALWPVARAAELTNAEAVLEFVLQKGESYDSFTSDFTQTIARQATMTGVFQFKKPAQTRLESLITGAGQTQRVVAVMGNDQVLWQEMDSGSGKNVIKMDLNTIPASHPAAALLKNPFETINPQRLVAHVKAYYAETLTGTTTLHGQLMYVLEGTIRPDAKLPPGLAAMTRGWGKQRLAIGQQDGFLHKVDQFDTSNTNLLMSVEFTALQFNGELPETLFTYAPSPTANVIDMTAILLQMMGPKKK